MEIGALMKTNHFLEKTEQLRIDPLISNFEIKKLFSPLDILKKTIEINFYSSSQMKAPPPHKQVLDIMPSTFLRFPIIKQELYT